MKTIKSDEKEILHEEWGGYPLHFLCRHFWDTLSEGFYTKGTIKTGKQVRVMNYSRCIGCGRQRLLISTWKENLPIPEGHGDTSYT